MTREPKAYPLDVQNIGDDTYKVMSKGHHDPHAFMRAVRADGFTWSLKSPKHLWFRCVPDRTGEFRVRYVEAEPHSPGAFPVTYADEAYGEDAYAAPPPPSVPATLEAALVAALDARDGCADPHDLARAVGAESPAEIDPALAALEGERVVERRTAVFLVTKGSTT